MIRSVNLYTIGTTIIYNVVNTLQTTDYTMHVVPRNHPFTISKDYEF